MELIIIGVLIVVALILIISNIHVVPQARAYVVERLGTYSKTWKNGIHFKIPFVDSVRYFSKATKFYDIFIVSLIAIFIIQTNI